MCLYIDLHAYMQMNVFMLMRTNVRSEYTRNHPQLHLSMHIYIYILIIHICTYMHDQMHAY